MEVRELACEVMPARGVFGHHGVGLRADLRGGGVDGPGLVARADRVGVKAVALDGHRLAAQADARGGAHRAERCGERQEAAALELDGGDSAVFDLDRVHPRRLERLHRPHRADEVEHEVVDVDRLGEEDAAELGRELSAPGHRVVRGGAPPRGLDRGDVGRSGQARAYQVADSVEARAEAVLEDRHHPRARSSLAGDDVVAQGERTDERLLADRVDAGVHCGDDHVVVQAGRGADRDDVDVVPIEHGGVVRRGRGDRVGRGERLGARTVGVAGEDDLEQVRQLRPAALHLAPCDPAAAHEGDP